MPSPSQYCIHRDERDELPPKNLSAGAVVCAFLTLARKTEGTLNSDDFYPHGRVIPIAQGVFKNSEIEACSEDVVSVDRRTGVVCPNVAVSCPPSAACCLSSRG